jgi:hypothetical protein
MEFQWDPRKAAANLQKHGVDFADAVGVFFDDRALTIDAEGSSEEFLMKLVLPSLTRVFLRLPANEWDGRKSLR